MVKKSVLVIILFLSIICFSQSLDSRKSISSDCRCNSVKLYGRVKVVKYNADFKVKIVTHHPDLKVQKVESFPNSCGKWQFVEHAPDFTVQFVDYGADFEIQYVKSFPGTSNLLPKK